MIIEAVAVLVEGHQRGTTPLEVTEMKGLARTRTNVTMKMLGLDSSGTETPEMKDVLGTEVGAEVDLLTNLDTGDQGAQYRTLISNLYAQYRPTEKSHPIQGASLTIDETPSVQASICKNAFDTGILLKALRDLLDSLECLIGQTLRHRLRFGMPYGLRQLES